MNARCARCRNIFRAEQYGSHTCPHCGAEVILRAPGEKPPEAGPGPIGETEHGSKQAGWSEQQPAAEPFPGGPAFPGAVPAAERTPWELREGGLLDAYVATVRSSLFDPVGFFERMPTDDAKGAITYYWITSGIALLLGGIWQAAASFAGFGAFDPSSMQLPPEYIEMFQRLGPAELAAMNIASGIGGTLLAPIALFIGAGVVHVGGLVFGSAGRGFDATLRATAYAAGPLLLQAIPLCGQFLAIIGFFWYVTLVVIGMWKLHGTETWRAAAAVLAPGLMLFCCTCCGIGSVMTFALGALGNAQLSP